MENVDITLVTIGLLLFVVGYTINEIQEKQKDKKISGMVICFVGGFLLALGLFLNSR